jgi:hypothetical protein
VLFLMSTRTVSKYSQCVLFFSLPAESYCWDRLQHHLLWFLLFMLVPETTIRFTGVELVLFLSLTHTFSSLAIMSVPCYNCTQSGLSFSAEAAGKKHRQKKRAKKVERHERRGRPGHLTSLPGDGKRCLLMPDSSDHLFLCSCH